MGAVIKKLMCITVALAMALPLLACTGGAELAPEMELSPDIPLGVDEINGEAGAFAASLYFLSDDELRLSIEEREIEYSESMSRAEAAIQALIDGPESTVLRQSVPGDLSLDRVEVSSDACNVYLLASYTPDARTWITARAAIAATVYACEKIATVNLYLNGVEPGYYGRALGAMSPITATLDSYIIELQQEYKEISEGSGTEAGIYETRTATLYFTDVSGTLLIAKNSALNYDSSEPNEAVAALLMSKLLDGTEELEAVLPADMTLSSSLAFTPFEAFQNPEEYNPEEWDSPHPSEILPGETGAEDPGIAQDEPMMITVVIDEPEMEYDPIVMCGAITLTLTGYIPNVQGVAIGIADKNGRVTQLAEKGYFTREDFADRVGRNIHIAYPDADGSLMHRVPRAVSSTDSYDPQRMLEELFKGPADPGVMYPDFGPEDVEKVYIVGNTVVVNWKAGFMDKLRAYVASESGEIPAERRERMFVYSVVNTLTEIQGISRVWMLENGKKLGKINEIYLGNALMRNPGILVSE